MTSYPFTATGPCWPATPAPSVALIDFNHPALVQHLAYGRIACTVIGVLAATAVTGLLMPPSGRRSLLDRTRQTGAELLERCSGLLTGPAGAADQGALLAVVARLGDLDTEADEVLDGAPGARWRKRRLRNLLASLLLVASRLRGLAGAAEPGDGRTLEELASLLERSAARFRTPEPLGVDAMPYAASRPGTVGASAEARAALVVALEDLKDLERAPATGTGQARLATPADWQGALRAATRTALCVFPMGLAWLATG